MKQCLFFLIVCFAIGCSEQQKGVESRYEINYIDIKTNGDLYQIYQYNNLIIGMFFNKKFFVIDSNYKHLLGIEEKLNSIPDVSGIEFFKNDLFLLLNNNKIVVFDSIFNRKNNVEIKLNKLKPTALFHHNDSFYLFNSKDFILLRDDYSLTVIDSAAFFHNHRPNVLAFGAPVYSDNTYNVYACGVGEFGGNVFFQNKKNHQTYSFPTYFGELFYYRGAYHLIHSYDNWSKYIRIKDPTKLYPAIITTDPSFCCNCDSGYKEYFYTMSEPERQQWDKMRDITTYFDTNRIQTITTFLSDSLLYSVCMTDSSFLVLQHTDTIKFIQSVPKMDKRIKYYSAVMKTIDSQKQVIGLGGTSWQLLDSAGFDKQIDRMGLIIIKGRKIDIYESYKETLVKAERIRR